MTHPAWWTLPHAKNKNTTQRQKCGLAHLLEKYLSSWHTERLGMKLYWCWLPAPSWASERPSMRLIHVEDDSERKIKGSNDSRALCWHCTSINGPNCVYRCRFKCCINNKWGQKVEAIEEDVCDVYKNTQAFIRWHIKEGILQMCFQNWFVFIEEKNPSGTECNDCQWGFQITKLHRWEIFL